MLPRRRVHHMVFIGFPPSLCCFFFVTSPFPSLPICVPVPLNTSNKAIIPEGLPIREIIPPLNPPLGTALFCT